MNVHVCVNVRFTFLLATVAKISLSERMSSTEQAFPAVKSKVGIFLVIIIFLHVIITAKFACFQFTNEVEHMGFHL